MIKQLQENPLGTFSASVRAAAVETASKKRLGSQLTCSFAEV